MSAGSNHTEFKKQCKYSSVSGNELLLSFPLRKSYSTLGDHSFSMAAPHVWNSLLIRAEKRPASTVTNTILKVNLKPII